jgi:hypothetical protein
LVEAGRGGRTEGREGGKERHAWISQPTHTRAIGVVNPHKPRATRRDATRRDATQCDATRCAALRCAALSRSLLTKPGLSSLGVGLDEAVREGEELGLLAQLVERAAVHRRARQLEGVARGDARAERIRFGVRASLVLRLGDDGDELRVGGEVVAGRAGARAARGRASAPVRRHVGARAAGRVRRAVVGVGGRRQHVGTKLARARVVEPRGVVEGEPLVGGGHTAEQLRE